MNTATLVETWQTAHGSLWSWREKKITFIIILNPINRRIALNTWLIFSILGYSWKTLIIGSSSFVSIMLTLESWLFSQEETGAASTVGVVDLNVVLNYLIETKLEIYFKPT